jgi:hypothetical protein
MAEHDARRRHKGTSTKALALFLAGAIAVDLLYCVASGQRADLLGAEREPENAATRIMSNVHTRIMPVGWMAGSPMSSRIYGQQADHVVGYCPALSRLPRSLDLGVRAYA